MSDRTPVGNSRLLSRRRSRVKRDCRTATRTAADSDCMRLYLPLHESYHQLLFYNPHAADPENESWHHKKQP